VRLPASGEPARGVGRARALPRHDHGRRRARGRAHALGSRRRGNRAARLGCRSRRRRHRARQHEPRRHAARDVHGASAPPRRQGAPGAAGPHGSRSMTTRRAGLRVAALALCLWPASVRAADPSPEILARGKYVFATAGGCGCHTPPDAVGLNAGGQKFELLVGTVYSRNITPDGETGIGKWTDTQVANAIRRGERPDGSRLFPIHPYKYLANIADDEIAALVAYLRSVKPIKSTVPARSLRIPVPPLTVPVSPKVAPREGLERGWYLAGGAAHCADCHTPRRFDGSPDDAKFMAGGSGPE